MYFEANIWYFCKKDCIFCSEWWYWKRNVLELKDFKKIIIKKKFTKVVLTWWEPILNPNLIEYINFCKENNIYVSLVTAFEPYLSENFIDSIINSWLDELMLSIQWPEKIHDFLIKQKWSFKSQIFLLNYLKYRPNKFRVILHTNINKFNYKVLPFFINKMFFLFPYISVYHIQALEYDWSAIKNKTILFDKYTTLFSVFFSKVSNIKNLDRIKFWRIPYCVVDQKYRFLIWNTPKTFNKRDWYYKQDMVYKEWIYDEKCHGCKYYYSCDKFTNVYVEKFWDEEIQLI